MIPGLLTSYTGKLSYAAGEILSLHVSNPETATADIELVRLDTALDSALTDTSNPTVAWDAAGRYVVGPQEGHYGSFLVSSLDADPGGGIAIGAWVHPLRSDYDDARTVVWLGSAETDDRIELALDGGVPVMTVRAQGRETTARADASVGLRTWSLLVGALHPDGTLHVIARPLDVVRGVAIDGVAIGAPVPDATQWHVGVGAANPREVMRRGTVTRGRGDRTFTGKIDTPFVTVGAIDDAAVDALTPAVDVRIVLGRGVVGCWNLAPGAGALNEAPSVVGGAPVQFVNAPTRGVTGRLWTAEVDSFLEAPDQFTAVHLHDTDVVDAGWEATVTAPLPEGTPSGLYGIRITTSTATDTVPFTVLPGDTRQRVLVVLPTFTYLAYANESIFEILANGATGSGGGPSEADLVHVGNPSFGLSQYDTHSDGSGVVHSTASRPITNMRPDYRNWINEAGRHLSADLYLIEWLTRNGIAFDLITDHELSVDPDGWLADARVLITGSHPEYTSRSMLDGLERFRDGGGRLMYLGGNGFYWVTGVVSDDPLVIEIRRGHAGVCAWKSEAGEVWLTSTKEKGGLWRFRGRPPQRLVGIGMAAQGWGGGAPFVRHAASFDDGVAWIFDGVEESPIGDYGRVMGAACGDEIDRADIDLGTPPHAVLLASSKGHSNYYQRTIEELRNAEPTGHGPEYDPEVKGDIVYFDVPGGGAVFAAGSIAFSGSLLENEGDNGISRMTRNVVTRFLEERVRPDRRG